jgi:hypothetical protein
MSYTVENTQENAIDLVLQTTEKTFSAAKTSEYLVGNVAGTQKAPEVYFQIED